jgi:hypothetical protein
MQDAEQCDCQTAPDKQDCLLTIVPDDRHIVLDVWIAIEKLVSPAPDENSGEQKDDYGDSEYDAQRGHSGLFDHR